MLGKNNYSKWELSNKASSEDDVGRWIADLILNDYDVIIIKETDQIYKYNKGVYTLYDESELKHKIKLELDEINDSRGFIKIKGTERLRPFIRLSNSLITQVENHLHRQIISYNQFDAFPEYVNCLSGVVNLITGSYSPHFGMNKHYLSTIQIPVTYLKHLECPNIEKFLIDVFGEDRLSFIYEIISYLLYRSNKFHKSFIFFGEASSGKTTFIELLRTFLGRGNWTDISIQDIQKKFQMANLRGMLADIYDELPLKKIGYMSNFKQIVTNNTLTGEMKGVQGSQIWDSFCKLMFTCNKLPETSIDQGDDFWRRIILIHCTAQFNNGKKDFDISKKISTPEELSGLLNKCVEHFPNLLRRKHFDQQFDNIAVQGIWQINVNPIKLFLDTNCSLIDGAKEETEYFRRQVNAFRKQHSALPLTANTITRKLKDIGIPQPKQKGDGKRYYEGIKINTSIIDVIENIILGGQQTLCVKK